MDSFNKACMRLIVFSLTLTFIGIAGIAGIAIINFNRIDTDNTNILVTALVTCDEIAPLWAIIDTDKEPIYCRGEDSPGLKIKILKDY